MQLFKIEDQPASNVMLFNRYLSNWIESYADSFGQMTGLDHLLFETLTRLHRRNKDKIKLGDNGAKRYKLSMSRGEAKAFLMRVELDNFGEQRQSSPENKHFPLRSLVIKLQTKLAERP